MSQINYHNMIKVTKTQHPELANKHLNAGWTLLEVIEGTFILGWDKTNEQEMKEFNYEDMFDFQD
ncbi:hypothetical protein [Bacillus sp. AG4(2022)]|jgi:hypothetical protein|uniref:hypothetical protein n=1 Tax=Bacillus sp. AG4(2022) TaxID=2962594 RepID=UPI002881F9FA|nr:hypothetical protein [Bacillus sp. AG4(2022)]MDT0160335.1 hypothetical protein [Bacillus sp. AG4(2022)]